MITVSNGNIMDGRPLEFRGKSTDAKPTGATYPYVNGIPNGSTLYCMDTGQIYMYDAAQKAWLEQ